MVRRPAFRTRESRLKMSGVALGACVIAGGLGLVPEATSIAPAITTRTMFSPQDRRVLPSKDVANDARRVNAAMPLVREGYSQAAPFVLGSASQRDRAQAIECMTSAIYYEAGGETSAGQEAVAQVIINRVRHPAFPGTICGVVYQGSTERTGCQFTFTCDGSLKRAPSALAWRQARQIAEAALQGRTFPAVGLATHYHADYVVPYWASTLTKSAVVGEHIFYRWPGRWGQSAAFTRAYRGGEQDADQLARAAMASKLKIAGLGTPGAAKEESNPLERLAALDLEIRVSQKSLGPKHPQIIALEAKRAKMHGRSGANARSELSAIDQQIRDAARTLGAKHPRMVALRQLRDEIQRKLRDQGQS